MANVSRAMYNDVRRAREARESEKLTVVITRLTKSGKPSQIPADTLRFATVEQAEQYIARIAQFNPGRTFSWQKNY